MKKVLLIILGFMLCNESIDARGGGGFGGGHGGGFGGHSGGGHSFHSGGHGSSSRSASGSRGGRGSRSGSRGGNRGGNRGSYNHGGYHNGWGRGGWGGWCGMWFGVGFMALTITTTALLLSEASNNNNVNPADQATADQIHQNMIDAQEAKQKRQEALDQIDIEMKQLQLQKMKGDQAQDTDSSSPLNDPGKVNQYMKDLQEAKAKLQAANTQADKIAAQRNQMSDEGLTDSESNDEGEQPVAKKRTYYNNKKSSSKKSNKKSKKSYDNDEYIDNDMAIASY